MFFEHFIKTVSRRAKSAKNGVLVKGLTAKLAAAFTFV
jgi:hypothetical protein